MREWSDFYRFGDVTNKYMPAMGEGDTIASQASTAINKLVYKWFNDGDVFDNTHAMQGWCNDLSTYANWLAYNIEGAAEVLDGIVDCYTDEDYTELLYDLCEQCCDDDSMELWNTMPKEGSIYTQDGDYSFVEKFDDEEGRDMVAQWIDTRDRQPTVNGDYLTQTACGGVGTTMYTVEGGWNSYIDCDGELHCGETDQNLYIVRWFEAPKPPAVPEEWYIEWLRG